jgi:hypothetical protein
VLLVKPGFSSDSAGAFKLLDRVREQTRDGDRFHLSPGKMSLLAWEKPPIDVIIKALEGAPETWPFFNDFVPVFLAPQGKEILGTEAAANAANAGVYREILAALKDAGAAFAGLSGAGSCCFGVFRVKETAEKAGKRLGIPGNFVKLTFFLAQKTIPVLE